MAYAKGKTKLSGLFDTSLIYQRPQHQHLNTYRRTYVWTDDFFWTSRSGDKIKPTPYARRHDATRKWIGTQITLLDGVPFVIETGAQNWAISLDIGPEYASEDLYNRALGRMFDKLRTSIDLSIDLAQWKQTRDTVGSLSKSVEQLGKSVELAEKRFHKTILYAPARRKYAAFKKMSKAVAGLWLQWVYGVQPTLFTLYDLVEKAKTPENNYYEIFGSAGVDSKDTRNSSNFGKVINTHKKRYRITCKFALARDLLEDLAGITTLNPAGIAWELMPYSFVVDWVYDIGGYIRSMETAYLHGSNFVSGFTSSSYFGDQNRRIQTLIGSIAYSGTSQSQVSVFERTVLTSIPMPKPPVFEVDLSVKRLFNALALVTVLLPDSVEDRLSKLLPDDSYARFIRERIERDKKRGKRSYF